MINITLLEYSRKNVYHFQRNMSAKRQKKPPSPCDVHILLIEANLQEKTNHDEELFGKHGIITQRFS